MKKVVVISGKSGVGKDTVINNLDDFERFASLTTRPKRTGEKDGDKYWFLNENDFLKEKRNGRLLDTVNISGYYYGFPIDDFLEKKNGLWALNLIPESGLLVKRIINDTNLIYLELDTKTQITRMRARGMTEYEIGIRLRNDPNPDKKPKYYDYKFINNESIETAKMIGKKWR